VPGFADLAIRFFGLNKSMRRRVASATRTSNSLSVLRPQHANVSDANQIRQHK